MTGKKWTSEPQEVWLKKQFPTFLQADSTATRKKFFADVCTEWQKRWADPEPSSDDLAAAGGNIEAAINIKRKAMDKRLKAWYDNHKRPTLSGKMDATVSASRSVLNLSRQRAWQPWQAYSDLKYKDLKSEMKIQFDAIMKKWDEGHMEGEKKPIWFTFQNTFLKEKLDGESDEMKAKVKEHRLKMLEVPPDEANRQYQIAIDKLPLTFATIMDNIAKQTGWNITIMAGGPRPSDEGKIATLMYTTGKTKDGRDFKEFLGTQLESIEGPYDDFLHECFSADDCAARAFCEGEPNEEVDDDDGKGREAKVDKTNEEPDSRDKNKTSKAKAKSTDLQEWPKSAYEIEREENIAENRALLASLRGPEFEAAMGELKKGPAVPRKKGKSKPDVEERRTSARLSTNKTPKSTDGDLSGTDAGQLGNPNENASQVTNDASQKPGVGDAEPIVETETPVDAVSGEPATSNDKNRRGNCNSDAPADEEDMGAAEPVSETKTPADAVLKGPEQNNNEGSINSLHHNDAPADGPIFVDHEGDVIMRDGNGHLGDSPHAGTPAVAVSTDANHSPTSTFTVSLTPAVTTSTSTAVICESSSQPPPATSTTTSQVGAPPGSAFITADELPPSIENIPEYLTPAVIAHLRGASLKVTWQRLVTAFLRFKAAGPPSGKLSTTARPPEVAPWIKRHIKKKLDPVSISNDFGARFRAWWTVLQPSWRVTSSISLSKAAPPKETWASLKKGGTAGLYVIVMALSWWVASLNTDSDDSQAMELVDDLSWVLSLLTPVASPLILSSASAKRRSAGSSDDEEEMSPPSKRTRL